MLMDGPSITASRVWPPPLLWCGTGEGSSLHTCHTSKASVAVSPLLGLWIPVRSLILTVYQHSLFLEYQMCHKLSELTN